MKRGRSSTKWFISAACLVVGMILLAACGGGGGGSSLDPPIADLSGTWRVFEFTYPENNSCGEDFRGFYTDGVIVTQSGNSITVSFSTEKKLSGTISGDQVNVKGSYPEEGGTTTVNNTEIIVQDEGYFIGTSAWTWKSGSESCNGTTTVEGVRLD